MTIYSIYSTVKIEEIIRNINCIDNNVFFRSHNSVYQLINMSNQDSLKLFLLNILFFRKSPLSLRSLNERLIVRFILLNLSFTVYYSI